jgi:hypothetical protein
MPGQERGDRPDGVRTVERVVPVDAVHVHVDEAGNHVVAVEVGTAAGDDVHDPVAFDDDRPRAQQPIGQDDVGAGEANHG